MSRSNLFRACQGIILVKVQRGKRFKFSRRISRRIGNARAAKNMSRTAYRTSFVSHRAGKTVDISHFPFVGRGHVHTARRVTRRYATDARNKLARS